MMNISYLEPNQGYTVIETLVALSILFMILIPCFSVLNSMLVSQQNLKKILAINLAEQELEKCLMTADYIGGDTLTKSAGILFRVRKEVHFNGRLVKISLEILDREGKQSFNKLSTFRHYDLLTRSREIIGE